MTDNPHGAMYRPIVPHGHSRVTYAELFFDLVFVFAVTQIAHTLLAHFTPLGVLQVTLLFLAVWWVWVFTTWITNWLDPEQTPVRLLLFAMMLGGLVLSTSIPTAFDGRGLVVCHCLCRDAGRQDDLSVGLDAAVADAGADERRPDHRMAVDVGGVLDRRRIGGRPVAARALGDRACHRIYLAGSAILDTPIRPILGLGLGDRRRPYGRTLCAFRHHCAWRIRHRYRCDIFRACLVGRKHYAFVSVLAGSIAMWWIYFHMGAEAGSEEISKSSEPGRLARLAYTYLHMPIIAGIIIAAVADELVLKHPGGHSDLKTVISSIGGPLLFLFGTVLFKHSFRGFLQLSHGFGIIALCLLAWFASELSPLMLSILTTAILIVVAVWESISLRSDPADSAFSQADRLTGMIGGVLC